MKVFVINPGATTTKIAIFQDEACIWQHKIEHPTYAFDQIKKMYDQLFWRKQCIEDALKAAQLYPLEVDCIIGRGGLLREMKSGTYKVNPRAVADMTEMLRGEHASNLGILLADWFADELKVPAYFSDPVSVDELEPVARISGHSLFQRVSLFHALNHKAVGRRGAKSLSREYSDCNFVICHLGGGVSVAAHEKGKVVDVNNVKDEGAFSMDRSGGLPITQLMKYLNEQRSKIGVKGVINSVTKLGGAYSYLETYSLIEVEQRIDTGDTLALSVFNSMAYQLAKDIGAMFTVLKGQVDALILTGGMANSKRFVKEILQYVPYISTKIILPGEFEMEAMAENALKALKENSALEY